MFLSMEKPSRKPILRRKRKIAPIKLDNGKKGIAPQSPRYTTYDKLTKAKSISELW